MSKNKKEYRVWVTETNTYSTIIEANNSKEAINKTMEQWSSIGPDSFKFEEVVEWDVVNIEETKQKEVA